MNRSRRDVRTALSGLRRIVRALRVSSKSAERALGVSGAQLFVLHELQAHPGASIGELAARTLTDQSSVSVVVGRLVTRGLVSRRAAADDGRRAELALTHAGDALLSHGPAPVQARLIKALAALDAKDIQVLARVLEKIADAVGAEPEGPMFFEEPNSRSRPDRARRT